MPVSYVPDDRDRTGMVIPVSKETYFNTKWVSKDAQLCAYDMLYHPADYDPKAARSDRKEPKVIRNNIWMQELPKPISSTNHMMYGRPYWKILDKVDKKHVLVQSKDQNPHMRIYNILEWATLIEEGKPSICSDS